MVYPFLALQTAIFFDMTGEPSWCILQVILKFNGGQTAIQLARESAAESLRVDSPPSDLSQTCINNAQFYRKSLTNSETKVIIWEVYFIKLNVL